MQVKSYGLVRGFHGTSPNSARGILDEGFRTDIHKNGRDKIFFTTQDGAVTALVAAIYRSKEEDPSLIYSIDQGVGLPVVVVDVPEEATVPGSLAGHFAVAAENAGLIIIRGILQIPSDLPLGEASDFIARSEITGGISNTSAPQ